MTPAMRAYFEANQPCTARHVAEAVGITANGVQKFKAMGEIRIVGWQRAANGRAVALYELGSGRHAPRPKAIPSRDVEKAYRDRHRALIIARRQFKSHVALGVWKGLL